MMYHGTLVFLTAVAAAAAREWWQLPNVEGRQAPQSPTQASLRIDTKVKFIEAAADNHEGNNVQGDDIPFKQPTDTAGFYNRPPGNGRYPVKVRAHRTPYKVNSQSVFPVPTYRPPSDGTVDSLQYCKCVSTLDCNPRPDTAHVCGSGQYLCCYKRPTKTGAEYFNEIEEDRPMLLPGQSSGLGSPFPWPGRHFGAFDQGDMNPGYGVYPDVLIGPGGPTGKIGPYNNNRQAFRPGFSGTVIPPGVLAGPDGPSDDIPPQVPENDNLDQSPAVLVGPAGPTGVIGPANHGPDGLRQSSTAQRPVLVGPGGPTGIIGPYRPNVYNRGVLVGPGGPTGKIGPIYNRHPGVLVGPGGPTGTIGPGRQVLVGPGGPTGQIGRSSAYFEKPSCIHEKGNDVSTRRPTRSCRFHRRRSRRSPGDRPPPGYFWNTRFFRKARRQPKKKSARREGEEEGEGEGKEKEKEKEKDKNDPNNDSPNIFEFAVIMKVFRFALNFFGS